MPNPRFLSVRVKYWSGGPVGIWKHSPMMYTGQRSKSVSDFYNSLRLTACRLCTVGCTISCSNSGEELHMKGKYEYCVQNLLIVSFGRVIPQNSVNHDNLFSFCEPALRPVPRLCLSWRRSHHEPRPYADKECQDSFEEEEPAPALIPMIASQSQQTIGATLSVTRSDVQERASRNGSSVPLKK